MKAEIVQGLFRPLLLVFGTLFTFTISSFAGAADLIPIEAFARLPQISQPALSPDGTHIAYLAPIGGQRNLVIMPLNQPEKAQAIPPVEETDIIRFTWINSQRIVLSYRYTNDIGAAYARTALFSVHVSKPGYVDMAREPKAHDANPYARQRPQIRDRIIDTLPDDPEHFLLAIDSDFDHRAEIRKVNVETGHYVNITEGYEWINSWVTDQNHKYRLGWGKSHKGTRLLYIDPNSGDAIDLDNTDWFENRSIVPLSFTADPTIAYALEPYLGDKKRLVTLDILSGEVKDVIFEHPEVEINRYFRDPVSGQMAGVTYTQDLTHAVYFDPDLTALKTQLDGWLPGGSNRIISWNKEKGLYAVNHVTDREDSFYLLNTLTGGAKLISHAIPVPADLLATTSRHTIEMRDGLPIAAYLTLPNDKAPERLPMVVLPHGGPHARDTMHYDFLSQFLANRGYAVLRPNFRGSTGYGERFRRLGRGQWGGAMQDDVTDATLWAIEQGIADPDRICIAGGSYGGYAALMGAIKEPSLYRCTVSINGATDLIHLTRRLKDNFLLKKYANTVGLKGEGAKLVSPYHRVKGINIPVLIIHAKDDPVVPFEHGEKMYKALKKLKKKVSFKVLENADHYFATEQSRIEVLAALEGFLATHLK
ncbi:alpha/beta hydrolase family protein [Kordiimonas aestuarii]|uniref:alpha/beta hydrolase family protein n=1 Tax=Kordiimonas aestuarii TaxID=1005925 RepID=UPI0021D3D85E|nr:alpha/beta fold hydrolase [Kordiimonas aestuarii]